MTKRKQIYIYKKVNFVSMDGSQEERDSFFSVQQKSKIIVVKRTWIITITTGPSSGKKDHCKNLNVLEFLPFLELSERLTWRLSWL